MAVRPARQKPLPSPSTVYERPTQMTPDQHVVKG